MSLRLEMLQVARLAPKLLDESAGLVRDFLLSQLNPDGGFKDRNGQSDLYYTVFGLDGLVALQAPLPTERVTAFLATFGDGEGLDFVHLCCLARCWAAVTNLGTGSTESRPTRPAPDVRGLSPNPQPLTPNLRPPSPILQFIERHRARDGGYHPIVGSAQGTAYGAFLALGAYRDLRAELPEPQRLAQSLEALRTADGAWSNEPMPRSPAGSTNATAAAVTVLRHLSVAVDPAVGEWLLARAHPQGGFLAMPHAPMPDLLSTATALHALAGLQVSFASVQEPCLDFVDSLWTNVGGFHGNWGDDHLDCEYTFYGLLALGHLSL